MRQIDSGAEYVAMEVSSHGIAQGRINGDVEKGTQGLTANDALEIQKKLLGLIMNDFVHGLEIKAAQLGNNAGMVGAVKYFIESSIREITV